MDYGGWGSRVLGLRIMDYGGWGSRVLGLRIMDYGGWSSSDRVKNHKFK